MSDVITPRAHLRFANDADFLDDLPYDPEVLLFDELCSIDLAGKATRLRIGRSGHVIRCRFEFRHLGDVCYEGEQTAVWMKIDPSGSAQPPGGDLG